MYEIRSVPFLIGYQYGFIYQLFFCPLMLFLRLLLSPIIRFELRYLFFATTGVILKFLMKDKPVLVVR